MGTSKSNPGASSPAWRKTRLRTKQWASTGGGDSSKGVNGVVSAAAGALIASGPLLTPLARQGVQRLGGLLGGFGTVGVDETLERLGLRDLIGLSGLDLFTGLLDYIANSPDEPEDPAFQAAARELLDEMQDLNVLHGDATIDVATAELLFIDFFAYYIAVKIMLSIADVLENVSAGEEALRREAEIREYVVVMLETNLGERSVLDVDWNGPDGDALVDELAQQVLEVFGDDA